MGEEIILGSLVSIRRKRRVVKKLEIDLFRQPRCLMKEVSIERVTPKVKHFSAAGNIFRICDRPHEKLGKNTQYRGFFCLNRKTEIFPK
jgi:hypothetical protein